MNYVNVYPHFQPNEFPEIAEKIQAACRLLETMLNSEMFKDMVLRGQFEEDNVYAYNRTVMRDVHITFRLVGSDSLQVGYSANQETDVVSAYIPVMKNYTIEKNAAVILHEYGHTIGFSHKTKWANSYVFFLGQKGERLFNKFRPKLGTYPRKGYWLTYEPVCSILWFWKKIKFNKI